jgi:hypothetical protein
MSLLTKCKVDTSVCRLGIITSENNWVGAGMYCSSPSRPQSLAMPIEAALGQYLESPDVEGNIQLLLRGQNGNAAQGYHETNITQPRAPSVALQGGDASLGPSALDTLLGTARKGASMNEQHWRLPLPLKLYAILSNPEYEHIISWLPHGRAWKIHDMDLFQTQILPSHFDSRFYPNSFDTFLQRLKLWGFRQFTRGIDTSAYFHVVSSVLP